MSGTTQTDAAAAGAQALTEAVRAACTDPADAIRLLTPLAQYSPTISPGSAPIGQDMATVQTAIAAVGRRAALASIALAAADYQPTSYADALALLTVLIGLFQAESEIAADADDAETYVALQSLQSAVVIDLTTRGLQVGQTVTVTRAMPLPALFLAYQLYQDTSRVTELVARVDPIHPAFMPTSFEALSS